MQLTEYIQIQSYTLKAMTHNTSWWRLSASLSQTLRSWQNHHPKNSTVQHLSNKTRNSQHNLLPMTDAEETCTRNLYKKLACLSCLLAHFFLPQISCT